MRKTRHWVAGCPGLIVATDHKPLLGLLEKEIGDVDNPRLRALMEKTLPYFFTTIHLPGIDNLGGDAASRNPVGNPEEDDIGAIHFTGKEFIRESYRELNGDDIRECESIEARARELVEMEMADKMEDNSELCAVMIDWNDIGQVTRQCKELNEVMAKLRSGDFEGEGISSYRKYMDEIKVCDGVLKYKDNVIVPKSLRPRILKTLHQGHTGVTGMRLRASGNVWWPELSSDIVRTRKDCWTCDVNAPSQPAEPPVDLPVPEYPMQMLAADYFELEGYKYLVIVDRYSNWPMVFRVHTKEGSNELCKLLRRHFSIFGCPDEIASDGGPQFMAEETSRFFRNWKVRHRLSSAYFPHSNLRAEQGVRTVKRLLRGNIGQNGTLDCDEVARSLLNYRNTPDRDLGRSPAQIIFGRAVKDTMPMDKGKYRPSEKWLIKLNQREEALRVRQDRANKSWTEHTRSMRQLKLGDKVRIQNQNGSRSKKWDKTGVIVQEMGNRQYQVRVDGSGRLSLRNRRFLKPLGVTELEKESSSDVAGRRYPRRIRGSPARFAPGGGDN